MAKASLSPSGTSTVFSKPKPSTQNFTQGSMSSAKSTEVIFFTFIAPFSLHPRVVLIRLVQRNPGTHPCQGDFHDCTTASFARPGFGGAGDGPRLQCAGHSQ